MTTTQSLDALPPVPARSQRWGNKPKAITAVVVMLGVIALVASRANGEPGLSLRTAVATDRSVAKTLDEVGTIEPVSAASVGFPVAGTIANVAVAKGAAVTRGQTLATLDTTDLQRAINSAAAQLAQAKLALADAIAGNSASNNNDSNVSAQATDGLADARQAVLDGQHAVSEKIAEAQAAFESATALCAAVTSEDVATCQSALTKVLNAQQRTAEAQQLLVAASNAFDAAISNKSQVPNSNAPASSTASAAQLVALQKEIDASSAALAVANQNLSAATIVSPIDGTVESIEMKVGDPSGTSTIKIVGPNGFEVTSIVAVEKLANIKLGQRASVKPDGSDTTRDGEVVAIGAPRTANGATSYPVTIGLDDDESLRNGSVASVSIVTGSAADGVAVPTSAVRTENGQSTVTLVDGSNLSVVSVTVGVVGSTWTQIKSGLKAGQRVLLANLDQALPDSATTSNNNGDNGNGRVEFGPVIGGPITGGFGPSVQVGPAR